MIGNMIGRPAAAAFLLFAGAACAADGPPRIVTATTSATTTSDGNTVIVISDKEHGRPGRERRVYTIRTNGDGVQALPGEDGAAYRVGNRKVKIITMDGPGGALALRGDGHGVVVEGAGPDCERNVVAHPGADGHGRTVTVICSRGRVAVAEGGFGPDCARNVVERPGADGHGRTVTILCGHGREDGADAGAAAAGDRTERLEHALARIEHEDSLSPEAKAQVEAALREAIEQARGRR
jgi:hypothetical protein